MERLLEELSFDAPEKGKNAVEISADYVHERLDEVCRDDDLSKYIL
jgi:ATP-dependent HslUV protease ATP-binding subunit HslU